MKILILFLCTLFLVSNSKKLFESIPFEESVFKDWSKNEIANIMGTMQQEDISQYPSEYIQHIQFGGMSSQKPRLQGSQLPKNFDSRSKWPQCIHPIRHQMYCGSCWAFATTGMLSDRICIKSKDNLNVTLSPQYLVSCHTTFQGGCDGGYPLIATIFLSLSGAVTEECYPYTSGITNLTGECLLAEEKCVNESVEYTKYKAKWYSVRYLTLFLNWMKSEIFSNGPVAARMMVYEDFLTYKSGIYEHYSGEFLGGHALKIIGWGHDDDEDIDYWIGANSWGTQWGEDGFFKIKMFDCGINEEFIFAEPDVE